MKTLKLYSIGLAAVMIFTFSQETSAQIVDFYTSPGYTRLLNNWNSFAQAHAESKRRSGASQSTPSSQSAPPEIPEYRRYPAVQFKPTGTRIMLEGLATFDGTPQEKEQIKQLTLDILNKYETAAVALGYPNDWALAYVSYVGLNSHVYNGKTEKPIILFEQNTGLRDVVAKYVTEFDAFNNVTDRQKQELYENLVFLGVYTYQSYEKALRENNAEELKAIKLDAARNLEIVGIKPPRN